MFLTDQFREFHRELMRLREQVARGSWVAPSEAAAGAAGAAGGAATAGAPADIGEPAPSAVWRALLALLERQSLAAGRGGADFAADLYRRAQYAMAALADEVFLHLEWSGREPWRNNLLEARLFGSHRAGEELFTRIEELLRDREVVLQDLARVYLMVLAAGFQGKLRGQRDGEREIEAYRQRLYRFVFGRSPKAVHGQERLVPQAYAATLDKGGAARLPHLRPWIWAVVLLTALWLAGGYALWRHEMAGLEPIVVDILHDSGAAAVAPAGDRH